MRTNKNPTSSSVQPLSTSVDSTTSATLTKSILYGKNDAGLYNTIPITNEGHIEVAIHDPLLSFGAINVENLHSIFQTDAVYGINSFQVNSGTTLTGTVVASDSSFVISSGTTIYANGYIQSRKRLRYKPGQGVICRFAAIFASPVASNYQVAGVGHACDGVYFAYKNLVFGILYVNRGVREIRTLTITTGSSTAQNITVTLNSVAYTVAVTNSGNIQRTVYEISQGTFGDWSPQPIGATVVFINDNAAAKNGTYSITASTAVGTFAQTQAGSAAIESHIPQSTWNGDKLDGTGSSGVTADWTKGNVFQIGMSDLGFGAIIFKIQLSSANSNNVSWITVHTMKLGNTLTTSIFRNPSFPFTASVSSAGSTTNVALKINAFSGFIEGRKLLHGNRFSYVNSLTTVGNSNFQVLFSIYNTSYFGGTTNQSVIYLTSISCALKHTSPCIVYIVKNAVLAGNPVFSQYSTKSCSYVDTTATTCTFSANEQLIWSGHMGDTGEIMYDLTHIDEELTIQPGEYISVCAKTSTGNATYVTASLNTREDQ